MHEDIHGLKPGYLTAKSLNGRQRIHSVSTQLYVHQSSPLYFTSSKLFYVFFFFAIKRRTSRDEQMDEIEARNPLHSLPFYNIAIFVFPGWWTCSEVSDVTFNQLHNVSNKRYCPRPSMRSKWLDIMFSRTNLDRTNLANEGLQ